MYYSGIGSEAGVSINQQIKATEELGWKHIDLRNIDNVNITDISDEQFDQVFEKLNTAGITVSCFASNVANWAKDPRKPQDFDKSLEELERAIPRMNRFGTKMIRGMSFRTPKEEKRYPLKEPWETGFFEIGGRQRIAIRVEYGGWVGIEKKSYEISVTTSLLEYATMQQEERFWLS